MRSKIKKVVNLFHGIHFGSFFNAIFSFRCALILCSKFALILDSLSVGIMINFSFLLDLRIRVLVEFML
jgi:hypothetical protein